MAYIFSIAAISMGISILACYLLVRYAPALRLVDHPDERRHHALSTPLIGGISILIGIFTTYPLTRVSLPELYAYLIGIMLLCIAGVIDDQKQPITQKKAWVYLRFLLQIAAGFALLYTGDIHIPNLGNLFGWGEIPLGFASGLFTIFTIVGLINAINMLDGIDGLAGSMALQISLILAIITTWHNDLDNTALLLIMAGSIGGFLWHNFPAKRPARTFMGDTGSMLLGFLLAGFIINFAEPGTAYYPPVAALWLLAIPVWDTWNNMLRRGLEKRSPFAADHHHLHHLLQQRGWSDQQIVTRYCLIQTLLSLTSLAFIQLDCQEPLLFYSFMGLFVLYALVTRKMRRTNIQ